MRNKIVHVIGGGTISHVRTYLALCAPAYGNTARRIAALCETRPGGKKLDVLLHLTKMANRYSDIETSDDLHKLAVQLTEDPLTKIVFFNAAVCDFDGQVGFVPSGHTAERLSSVKTYDMRLSPADKILGIFRKKRKDINPLEVIQFIEENFDLGQKTGGYQL